MERLEVDTPLERSRLRALAAQLRDGGALVLRGAALASVSELDVLLAGLSPPDAAGVCTKQAAYARVDEDALLTPGDAVRPERADCGTAARRRACANCTCGLAESGAASDSGAAQPDSAPAQAKSACGSCYLGDAFRCAGCPYRGLPPFREGETVTLPADYLSDD